MSKSDQRSDDDNEVGYRKPPKSSRFEKGRSGNPRGRPKSADRSAARPLRAANKPTEAFFELEAYRPIARSDGGPDMTANQAMIRVLQQKGLQGSRLSAQYLLQHALKAEALAHQKAKEEFGFWSEYKGSKEPIVRGRQQPYWPSQDMMPHPDDIHLGPGMMVSIHGPVDKGDAVCLDYIVALRDVWLKLETYHEPDLERQRRRAERNARSGLQRYARMPPLCTDDCISAAWLIAMLYDAFLRRRFRLDVSAMEAKRMNAQRTSRDELAAQIRSEFAILKLAPPEPLGAGTFVTRQNAILTMETAMKVLGEAEQEAKSQA